MKNKVTTFVLTLTAGALLAATPVSAQLGGVVRNTVGAQGSAQGQRGGLTGGLGVDQTLNGSANRGGIGVDSTLDSSMEASAQGQGEIKETATGSKAKVKKISEASVDKTKETKAKTENKVDATVDKTRETVKSTEVSSSTDANGSASANSEKGSKSASSKLGLGNSTNGNVAGQQVSADAKADADAKAELKREAKEEKHDKSSENGARVENSNSGETKLHGLERAESRVENDNAVEAINKNQQRQSDTSAKVKSTTKGAVKSRKGGKQ